MIVFANIRHAFFLLTQIRIWSILNKMTTFLNKKYLFEKIVNCWHLSANFIFLYKNAHIYIVFCRAAFLLV